MHLQNLVCRTSPATPWIAVQGVSIYQNIDTHYTQNQESVWLTPWLSLSIGLRGKYFPAFLCCSPIVPAPRIATDLPGPTLALMQANKAFASGSISEPSSKLMLSGISWQKSSEWSTYRQRLPCTGGVAKNLTAGSRLYLPCLRWRLLRSAGCMTDLPILPVELDSPSVDCMYTQ